MSKVTLAYGETLIEECREWVILGGVQSTFGVWGYFDRGICLPPMGHPLDNQGNFGVQGYLGFPCWPMD